MSSSGYRGQKLKTNLKLSINRLKFLEKKKTEITLKWMKETADYICAGKVERARLKVESNVREDYLVAVMELLELYCDLLLARFGLIDERKELDSGLEEAVSSIIWATPHLQTEVQELKVVSEQLSHKFGNKFAQECRANRHGTVNEKLLHKLSSEAPPKATVENYMIEIARRYNVTFEPDPSLMDLGIDYKYNSGVTGDNAQGGGMFAKVPGGRTYLTPTMPPPFNNLATQTPWPPNSDQKGPLQPPCPGIPPTPSAGPLKGDTAIPDVSQVPTNIQPDP